MTRLYNSSQGRFLVLAGFLLILSACSTATATGSQGSAPASPPSSASTQTATASQSPGPALLPVKCSTQYGSVYQATLPDSSYSETMVYAHVPLPPKTRSYDNDATGQRARFLCSAGTTKEVLAFMQARLPKLGWQSEPTSSCFAFPGYKQQQCWQDGSYQLSLDLNSNADWVIEYLDPAFLCNAMFTGTYQATLPDSTYSETTVYANVQLPPQTLSYDSDASGNRFRFMCSSTTDSVQTFMHTRLTKLGWTQQPAGSCFADPSYSEQECWQNGAYQLSLDINSNTDWLIEYLDPAFLS